MLTRVVLSPRVKAAVKRAHMAALNARLRRKNVPRTRNSTILFEADREKKVAMCEDRVDVRAVVVLINQSVSQLVGRSVGRFLNV